MKELIERQTLEQLVESYDDVINHITKGFIHLHQAKTILRSRLGSLKDKIIDDSPIDYELGPDSRSWNEGKLIARTERDIRSRFWAYCMELSGIKAMMGPKELQRYHEMLRDTSTLPPFDRNNILATLQGLVESREQIFLDSVFEAYDWLRPRRWDPVHKTNRDATWRLPAKIILTYGVEWCGYSGDGYFRLLFDAQDNLRHVDRVFHALDGKGQPKPPNDLVTAIQADMQAHKRIRHHEVETEYFRARWFKVGTIHIWFLRKDLLKEFNRIAGEGQNQLKHKQAV